MAVLKVTMDGKPARLNCDTFTVEGTGVHLDWSTAKRIKTPQGDAFKFSCHHLVHCEDPIKFAKVIDNLSSKDPLVDHLLCFIQHQLHCSEHGDVEGVFRVNGESERVKVILRLGRVTTGCTIHDAASALKQRLKQVNVFSDSEQCALLTSDNTHEHAFLDSNVVFQAIKRLCRIVMSIDGSRMNADNLAVCLAPSLFDMTAVQTPEQIKRMTAVLARLLCK